MKRYLDRLKVRYKMEISKELAKECNALHNKADEIDEIMVHRGWQ